MADVPLQAMETILFESVAMAKAQKLRFEYVIEMAPNRPGFWSAYIRIEGRVRDCSDEHESPAEAIQDLYHKTEARHGYPHDQTRLDR
jgi:hypothetical protein